MSDTGGKKKRKSRKTKEEKMLEKVTKEQKAEQENKNEKNNDNEQSKQMPFQATPEQKQLMQNTDINQKMMDMDVRIKYGFIKTLHNNLTSINRRFNWDEDELMAIGMIFRDLQSIELNVFNTVMQNEDNEAIEEVDDEEEEEEEEEVEEAN